MAHTEIPDLPGGPNHSLSPINPFRARSTYALILTVLAALVQLFPGLDAWLEGFANEENRDSVLDSIMAIVAAVDELILVVSPIWLWLERRAPWRRLSFRNR